MRGSGWVTICVLAIAAAGCSPRGAAGTAPPSAPAETVASAPAAVPVDASSAAAETPPAETPASTADAVTQAAPAAPPAAAAPPAHREERVHFSPADYSARERRLSALIANAETRDTTGETQYRAGEGRAQRQRCMTKVCIERSYAVEEAWLRRWEGAGDVR